MKIVCAFDGSTPAEAIVPKIAWLTRVPGASFTFLSFVSKPRATRAGRQVGRPVAVGFAGPGGTPITIESVRAPTVENRSQAIDRALTEHQEYLEDIVSLMPSGPEYAIAAGVATDPGKAITRYLAENEVDLIVIGSHGEGGLLHRLLGGVREEVVHLSRVPVLIVHSN